MGSGKTVGVIGGTGQLGSAIALGWLSAGTVAPDRLWISNRAATKTGFEDFSDVHFTHDNQVLADACDIVLVSVPPAMADDIKVSAPKSLVLSVIAGVTIEAISASTGSNRVIRVMSNPAARLGLAYSVWHASDASTAEDRLDIQTLLEGIGVADEVPDERQIDLFTALTGPVPGFVAFYAASMVAHAVKRGIDKTTADRAVRQLFKSAGIVMAQSPVPPSAHVTEMIDYAGTTADGLLAMQNGALANAIAEGLDAAFDRAQAIGSGTNIPE